uniref:hypothetical protein n=1 Tax=Sutterella wadsworthensis TaxID=40545 RepID=UPI003078E1A7
NALTEAPITVFSLPHSRQNTVRILFYPPPLLLSSALVFLMNSGVLSDEEKELSSDEAKTIMIDVP